MAREAQMSWLNPDELVLRGWSELGVGNNVKEFLEEREALGEEWEVGEIQHCRSLYRFNIKPYYVRVTKVERD